MHLLFDYLRSRSGTTWFVLLLILSLCVWELLAGDFLLSRIEYSRCEYAYNQSDTLYDQGKYSEGRVVLQAGMQHCKKAHASPHIKLAKAHYLLGMFDLAVKEIASARANWQLAVEIATAVNASRDWVHWASAAELGDSFDDAGDYQQAMTWRAQALQAADAGQHPTADYVELMDNLATTYQNLEKTLFGLGITARLLECDRSQSPVKFEDLIDHLCQMAILQADLERYEEAHDALAEAHVLASAHESNLSKRVIARLYNDTGYVYVKEEKYIQATQWHTKALELRESFLPPDAAAVAQSLHNLGIVLLFQKRFAQAVPYLSRAAQIMAHQQGEHHPQTDATRDILADAYDGLGQKARAKQIRALIAPKRKDAAND